MARQYRVTPDVMIGRYFPIPAVLESFLVTRGDGEIRLELMSGNLIDMRTAKHWVSRETDDEEAE